MKPRATKQEHSRKRIKEYKSDVIWRKFSFCAKEDPRPENHHVETNEGYHIKISLDFVSSCPGGNAEVLRRETITMNAIILLPVKFDSYFSIFITAGFM